MLKAFVEPANNDSLARGFAVGAANLFILQGRLDPSPLRYEANSVGCQCYRKPACIMPEQ